MKKSLLIIGFVWPEPNSSAAGSRMLQLINMFLKANYEVTFATTCVKTENAFDLKSIKVKAETIQLNHSSFDTFIKKLNPSVVMFDRFMTEEQFGWRVSQHCPNAFKILDTEDLHFLRKGRHEALKNNAFFDISYLQNDYAKREIASILRCDLTFIISQVEQDILITQFGIKLNLLHYLPFLLDPISIEAQKAVPNFKERANFITIGNFLHEPNTDAIRFLKSEIWPIIRQKLPDAQMHIYGAYAAQKHKQLEDKHQGFLIKGYTDNVSEVVKNAKVLLAPLRFGAGLKGKLIDAMQNGTPCITTTIGAEGMYGTIRDTNAFIADDPEQFAKHAIELYTNKIYWRGKQKNGFMILNTLYDKNIYLKDTIETIENLQADLIAHRQQNFIGQMLTHHTLQSNKYMSKWIEEKNK
ncbi:glycosyltransferase family 4 protein [Mesoflavibacter profundi]|uniref:Glycosyltransferase family 4 protein n=1 Tax=Mesoflavibacter profundi TaxID=2708110 RepID=A0ABT4RYT0_9FLAO|nr:glycosyltransferase [Mesoflavibacter profundi]MDA0176963.1 glycosyltransferase family 4 protein [Mesoflavibacter profundi]